eukprot:Opistho-1_new@4020
MPPSRGATTDAKRYIQRRKPAAAKMSVALQIDSSAGLPQSPATKYSFRLRKYVPCLFRRQPDDSKCVSDDDVLSEDERPKSALSSKRIQIVTPSPSTSAVRTSATLDDVQMSLGQQPEVDCDEGPDVLSPPPVPPRALPKRVSIIKGGEDAKRRESARRVSFNTLVDVQMAHSPEVYDRRASVLEPLTPTRIQMIGQELALYKLTEMAVHRDSVSNISLPYVR